VVGGGTRSSGDADRRNKARIRLRASGTGTVTGQRRWPGLLWPGSVRRTIGSRRAIQVVRTRTGGPRGGFTAASQPADSCSVCANAAMREMPPRTGVRVTAPRPTWGLKPLQQPTPGTVSSTTWRRPSGGPPAPQLGSRGHFEPRGRHRATRIAPVQGGTNEVRGFDDLPAKRLRSRK